MRTRITQSLSVALLTLSLGGFLALSAAAQQDDSGEQRSETADKGTVIKGRVPISKDILKVNFPRPKEYTLKNGLRILVLEDKRLPTIHATFLIKAGSLYESKKGVASLTGMMLDEGSQSRSKSDIQNAAQGMGATLNAGAGELFASVSVSGLSDNTDRMIDLLADVLLHPSFPQEHLDRLKSQRIESLSRQRTDPNSLVNELESRVLYGDSAYVRLPMTASQVSAITRDDLVNWYDQYYRPNHAILGVTGDIDGDRLVARLEHLLADWKPGGAEPKLPPTDKIVAKPTTRVYIVARPRSQQTVLDFSNIGIKRTDPDYPALVVANQILGGGGTGRLFQNLRESKGYTYGAYSTLSANRWPGIWGAYASVRNEVTSPATAEFFKEFARIQNTPPDPVELDRAKRLLIGGFVRTLESTDGILGRAMEIEQYSLPANYWEDYTRRLQSVTPQDVQRVSKKYLGDRRIQVFAVGERALLEEALKPFGPITVYDRTFKDITATPVSGGGK